jgi:hypothetical protein
MISPRQVLRTDRRFPSGIRLDTGIVKDMQSCLCRSVFLAAVPLSCLVGLLCHNMILDEPGETVESETGNGEPANKFKHRNLVAQQATAARCRNVPKRLSPQNLTPARNFVGERAKGDFRKRL